MTTKAQPAEPETEKNPWSREQIEGIHNAMKSLDEGHGFGLHACANAMTEMGGSIQLDEGRDRGASFVLRFPLV